MKDDLVAEAGRTIAVGSKSFAAAARLFDRRTRESAILLYAWCRHCDDVVDGQSLGHGQLGGDRRGAAERLAELERQTRAVYAGEPPKSPAFAALQRVASRHALPEELPLAHLDGFRMDVEGRRYTSFSDTLDYCWHVAGVVGVMMARVMGAADPATLDRAADLGLAFQLTNIARDIAEDAGIGRVYVPEQWLIEAGIPPSEVAAEEHRDALALVTARLVDAAEPYYDSARDGLAALPLRSAWAIATARAVYREIGTKIERLGPDAWTARVSTSGADKLRLAAAGAATAVVSRFRRVRPRQPDLWARPA